MVEIDHEKFLIDTLTLLMKKNNLDAFVEIPPDPNPHAAVHPDQLAEVFVIRNLPLEDTDDEEMVGRIILVGSAFKFLWFHSPEMPITEIDLTDPISLHYVARELSLMLA